MHNKGKVEHESLLKKIQVEKKKSEGHISAERDGAFSRYHGVLRLIWAIVRAADERNAGHANTLTHLQHFFQEGRKMKAILSTTGPSQKKFLVAELESVLEATRKICILTVKSMTLIVRWNVFGVIA